MGQKWAKVRQIWDGRSKFLGQKIGVFFAQSIVLGLFFEISIFRNPVRPRVGPSSSRGTLSASSLFPISPNFPIPEQDPPSGVAK